MPYNPPKRNHWVQKYNLLKSPLLENKRPIDRVQYLFQYVICNKLLLTFHSGYLTFPRLTGDAGWSEDYTHGMWENWTDSVIYTLFSLLWLRCEIREETVLKRMKKSIFHTDSTLHSTAQRLNRELNNTKTNRGFVFFTPQPMISHHRHNSCRWLCNTCMPFRGSKMLNSREGKFRIFRLQ